MFLAGIPDGVPASLFVCSPRFILMAIVATLIVDGPTPLQGEIEVAGAKSSMSKLLTVERCEFANVPAIGDTEITKAISEGLAPAALRGAEFSVPDLRAAFTYLIAGVCAEGRSVNPRGRRTRPRLRGDRQGPAGIGRGNRRKTGLTRK